jgi:mannose-6-phosphate isomerase-like protein (cupin superfamily)
MKFEERSMKTTMLPEESDAKSPAGADIRFLMDGKTGGMIHSTVPPHQINKATVHATVSEFWYVLEGHGEIWRDDGKESNITVLVPGTSIDIPVGTAFQYRNVSDVELKFICITMPPWTGESEATYVKGICARLMLLIHRSQERSRENMAAVFMARDGLSNFLLDERHLA